MFFIPADGISTSIGHTSCSRTTRRRIARIRFFNTSLVITDITTWAIRIPCTFRSTSSDGIRFGNKARFTSTNGVGISVALFRSSAPSSRSTRWRIARIRFFHTSLVQADITTWAVRIPGTFRSTSSDGIRFRNQARFTIANGIANIVDSANCSRSTGGRYTRIGRSTGSAFYKNMNRG